MVEKPTIAIIGTLNTKECEGYYLKDRIEAHGGIPLLVDTAMRIYTPKLGKPDISNVEVAKAAGSSIEDVEKVERGPGQEIMAKGVVNLLQERLKAGKLDGIVTFGGSVGLILGTKVLKEFPMFFPKYVVTTIAADAGPQIAGTDITAFWSICDMPGGVQINMIEMEVFNRVAAAIVAAAAPKPPPIKKLPTIVATQFGNTTPCIIKAKDYLTEQGYDFIAFHAIGKAGGFSMEELIRDGFAVGVFDVTTHELIDELVGGVLPASFDDKLRLTAAGEMEIPQIVTPACVDMVNFWAPKTVPEKFKDRLFYEHSKDFVTLMRINKEESYGVGKMMAERVNIAKGPTLVVFPLSGLSMDDNSPEPGTKPEPGVYCADYNMKPTDKPWWDPEANKEIIKALKEHLDLSKPNIDFVVLDYNVNEPEFAMFLAQTLEDMIKGKWKKGQYPHVSPDKIVPLEEALA